MEKLLEFKKSRPWGENSKYYRFQCDRLEPSDAMDICVDSYGEKDEGKFITISLHFYGTCLWDRIKYAFAILRGNWAWREFIPRNEDYSQLARIFGEGKFSELP